MSPLPRISTDETSSLPGETIHPFLRFLQAHCSLCQCLMPGVRQQDILPRSAAGIPEQFPASLWNARTAVQMLSDAPAGRIKKVRKSCYFWLSGPMFPACGLDQGFPFLCGLHRFRLISGPRSRNEARQLYAASEMPTSGPPSVR